MRVLLGQINTTIGDLPGNTAKILEALDNAKRQQCQMVIFPELAVTGYPPDDLLLLPHFIDAVEGQLRAIIDKSEGIVCLVGTPRVSAGGAEKGLYNSCAVISNGTLLGFQDKRLLPTYDVFDERRYFEAAGKSALWPLCGYNIAITICEDIWQHATSYKNDPIEELAKEKPDFLINISASPFSDAKTAKRLTVCRRAVTTLQCPLLLCNHVGANDSLIFDGASLFMDGMGAVLRQTKSFQEELLIVDTADKTQEKREEPTPIAELYRALVLGIRDYFHKQGFVKGCVGLSGGIDSAVVACLAADALDSKNILAVSMPSRYSSQGSIDDAEALVKTLAINYCKIPIEAPFTSYLELLKPHFDGKAADATEENIQARIRGMILMALSNKHGYIVLSTGNKSELAMGYATLYGDMCGGLNVLGDVTKKEVYRLARWINRDKEIIPVSTITKAPSAELRLNQKDSDSLPDYDIVDNVVEAYIIDHLSPEAIAQKYGYELPLVQSLIRRIHANEYKRRQAPPSLRITEKAFAIGRRFPIVQRWA